ncbi:hypothetical protein PV371_36810 [Streptomyces sp. TX20-6-3]|uniref:hypothetical protein n=1 Tax=Streptomyces sp. TX20-6-3 TaxID=3028705 RepID=UPI0029A332BC|nr:hypothetical protein [Streptomyces sp. TX20-6-3]MDX2565184.1 hypothetical protein [Streptomyces sp. TX20-6-3]
MAVASSVGAASVSAVPAASIKAASAASGMTVVAPGKRITIAGYDLWLTTQGLHVAAQTSPDTPNVTRVADVLPGKVSASSSGDATGVLWSGIYRGPVTSSTKVTISLGARTLHAKVVMLAGKPGWGAFYVFDTKGRNDVKPAITVQT